MNGEHPRSQKELSFGASREGDLQVLWEDGERMFCRGWRTGADGGHGRVLVVLPAAEHPSLEPRTPHPRIWIEGSACWRVGPCGALELDERDVVLSEIGRLAAAV
jgi:hypothetical protein